MLKTVVLLNIFVETETFFLIILESSNILTDICKVYSVKEHATVPSELLDLFH